MTANFQTIAAADSPIENASFDLTPIAGVSSLTPSGHYAATLTVIATGKF